ncbi:phosphate ABC transporter ATP-binding protein [Babesia caballi]|uniref:Phosphate ABC transporter ATP-binding protein n=1 Tax=Babesia caballi TaxID=5871 RepID=A0AAV4M0X6_BABCB|nr:phosphate ABC transporter ATP-binding protein [Babesia caballi]
MADGIAVADAVVLDVGAVATQKVENLVALRVRAGDLEPHLRSGNLVGIQLLQRAGQRVPRLGVDGDLAEDGDDILEGGLELLVALLLADLNLPLVEDLLAYGVNLLGAKRLQQLVVLRQLPLGNAGEDVGALQDLLDVSFDTCAAFVTHRQVACCKTNLNAS